MSKAQGKIPHTLALILMLMLAILIIPAAQANSVSIRADYWYPMNGTPNSEKPGYMIEFAELIFAEHGYDVDYQLLPWQRAIAEVQQGKSDCVVGAYHEDAPNFVFPTESWGEVTTAIYVRSDDSFSYTDLASLSNREIGIIAGYAYSSEAINLAIKQHQFNFTSPSGANPLAANIQKLLHGRIDTIIENPAVMAVTLHESKLSDKVKLAGYVGQPSAMYIACSPENERSKQLVEWVNQGTKALRKSGKLKMILQGYGLNDWH